MPRGNFLREELEEIPFLNIKCTMKRENFKREEMQVIVFLNISFILLNGKKIILNKLTTERENFKSKEPMK